MDSFARGLMCAVELFTQGVMEKCVKVQLMLIIIIFINVWIYRNDILVMILE